MRLDKTTIKCLATLAIALFLNCVPPPDKEATSAREAVELPEVLSTEQLKALESLRRSSIDVLNAGVWRRGRSVERLDLRIPTGFGTKVAGEELVRHAAEFVSANGVLWNFGAEGRTTLEVGEVFESGDCRYVTFGESIDGLRVANARLRVSYQAKEKVLDIVNIVGRVDGAIFEVKPQALEKAASIDALTAFLRKTSKEQDKAWGESFRLAVIDPFFLDDSAHDARVGYLAEGTVDPVTGSRSIVGLDATEPGVIIFGTTFGGRPSGEAPFACASADPTDWMPAITTDDETETAATVSFVHMGGVVVAGAKARDRAYSLLSLPQMMELFGDFAPQEHLSIVKVRETQAGASVSMVQTLGGLRIEGSGADIDFDARGRVTSIFARRITKPTLESLDAPISDQASAIVAWTTLIDSLCHDDTGCRLRHMASEQPSVEKVIFSPRILRAANLNRDVVAWRFEFPSGTSFVSAATGAPLIAWPKSVGLTPTRVVDTMNPAVNGVFPAFFVNGQPTPLVTAATSPEVTALNAAINNVADFYEANYTATDETGVMVPFRGFNGLARIGASPGEDVGVIAIGYDCARPGADGGNDPCASFNAQYNIPNAVNPIGLPAGSSLFFAPGMVLSASGAEMTDIVAHEWAHGITQSFINWDQFVCEERTLNESLSDILAESAFPSADGSWDVGEGITVNSARSVERSPLRNMANPRPTSHAVYDWPVVAVDAETAANNSQSSSTCPFVGEDGRADFGYARVGPPNRMAQLIADGVSVHQGIGRAQTHRFYMALVQARALNGRAALRVKDLGDKARLTCRGDISNTMMLPGFDSDEARCDLIEAAGHETRVLRPRRFGWVVPDGYGVLRPRTTLALGRLFRGCEIAGQRLRVLTGYGTLFELELTTTPRPAEISILGGQTIVRVVRRGADADPTDRLVEVEVESKYAVHRPVEVDVIETFTQPAGVTSQTQCTEDFGHHPRVILSGRTYYPDPLTFELVVQNVAPFTKLDFFGSRGFVRPDGIDIRAMVGTADGTPSGAITLPSDDRCTLIHTSVRETFLEPDLTGHELLSLQQSVDHPGHSFRLQDPLPVPPSLFARIEWIQAIGSRIAFQVAWHLSERDDTDCLDLINSLHGDNGAVQIAPAAASACTFPECL